MNESVDVCVCVCGFSMICTNKTERQWTIANSYWIEFSEFMYLSFDWPWGLSFSIEFSVGHQNVSNKLALKFKLFLQPHCITTHKNFNSLAVGPVRVPFSWWRQFVVFVYLSCQTFKSVFFCFCCLKEKIVSKYMYNAYVLYT